MTFLVVALQSEAKPLVRHFALSGTDAPSPYRVYRSDDVTLVVSGVGRVASAAATAFAFAHAGERRDRPWINVGIAGHASAPIGSGWVAHKISERATGRAWYPSLVFDPPTPTAALTTVDEPELQRPGTALYDMEASAFFAIASRFSVIELVQVFKVVSDNARHPISRIDRAEVARLIEGRLGAVDAIVTETRSLAEQLDRPQIDLGPWTSGRRVSVSQERRLSKLLARLAVVEQGGAPDATQFVEHRGVRELLAALERRLQRLGAGYQS